MDAFPVTFLQCCACDVPVISNRLPAYSSNGIAKYLTFVGDNDDYYALSQEIVTKCCSGVDKLLLQEARAHITRRFDESAFGDELVCAYKELLQEGVQSSNVREGVIA